MTSLKWSYRAAGEPLLVLFHGSGGTIQEMLDFGKKLTPTHSLLVIQGDYTFGSGYRYYPPLEENQNDLDQRYLFQEKFEKTWEALREIWENRPLIFLGYSNGANAILSLLEMSKDLADDYLLLHPSLLQWNHQKEQRGNFYLFLGENDPWISKEELEAYFEEKANIFPSLHLNYLSENHAINQVEFNWLEKFLKKSKKT